ncbi:MAG: hypothetical protein MZV64_05145, partial [Ignavibacteriales bacterium]|nr:hypothetical protein [Ignavibacteriales bacterium]
KLRIAKVNTKTPTTFFSTFIWRLDRLRGAGHADARRLSLPCRFAILLYDYCFLKADPWKLEAKDKRFIISFIMLVIFIFLYLINFSKSPLSIFNAIPPSQGYAYSISMKEYFYPVQRHPDLYPPVLSAVLIRIWITIIPLSTSFFQLKTFFSFSLLVGILAAGILMFKRYRLIAFGIFWFFLTISVESSIIPISQNVIFEHRTYLPGFGFFLALTGAFFYFFKERYLKIAVIILLMIACHEYSINIPAQQNLEDRTYLYGLTA